MRARSTSSTEPGPFPVFLGLVVLFGASFDFGLLLAIELAGKRPRVGVAGTVPKTRALARGVSEEEYMAGNLLGKEVEAHLVASAFVALAKAERSTAHVMTVDGGNIGGALR
ncbi:MAG: hypothetical protein AAFY99_08615 [Pseudomonadota bacterium]